MPGRKFNARRAPAGQIHARVESTARFVIAKMAGKDIAKVNIGMIETAAMQNGIPPEALTAHLRELGALKPKTAAPAAIADPKVANVYRALAISVDGNLRRLTIGTVSKAAKDHNVPLPLLVQQLRANGATQLSANV